MYSDEHMLKSVYMLFQFGLVLCYFAAPKYIYIYFLMKQELNLLFSVVVKDLLFT